MAKLPRLDTNIHNMSAESLKLWLSKFIQEVCKGNGQNDVVLYDTPLPEAEVQQAEKTASSVLSGYALIIVVLILEAQGLTASIIWPLSGRQIRVHFCLSVNSGRRIRFPNSDKL